MGRYNRLKTKRLKLKVNQKNFIASILVICTLLFSCSTTPIRDNVVSSTVKNFFTSNLWINSFSKVIFGYPDYPLTREMIEDIPYASLRIKIGKGPAGLMILQEKTDDKYSWVSKDSVLLKIKGGRIVRSSNLNNDLVDYYYDDDINFTNLTNDEISLPQSDSALSIKDIVSGDISFKELIKLEREMFYLSSRTISLENPQVRGLNIQVSTKIEKEEIIEILGREYEVVVIKEVVQNETIDWKHENFFWVDKKTGFVWKSLQQIAPNVPPISLEITKAPAI